MEEEPAAPQANIEAAPKAPRAKIPVSFRRVERFFTTSELAFYEKLYQAVYGRFVIMSKVRLLDLVQPEGDEQERFTGKGRVAQKHLDFVLLRPSTYEVVAAIELDGSSHARPMLMADRMSSLRVLGTMLTEPYRAFVQVIEAPTLVLPFGIAMLAALFGFAVVLPATLLTIESTQAATAGIKGVAVTTGILVALVTPWLAGFVSALALAATSMVFGGTMDFRTHMSVAGYARIPLVIQGVFLAIMAFDHGYTGLENVVGGSWSGVLSFLNTVGGYAGGGAATGALGGAWVGSIAGPGVGTLGGAVVGGVIGGGVGLFVGVAMYINGERR